MRTITALILAPAALFWAVTRPPEIGFEKHEIDPGASETCALADPNGDRKPDIVSGEYWYEAPSWKAHRFRELPYANGYIDNFSDLPIDVDGDGRIDIVSVSYFRKCIRWWRNSGSAQPWAENSIREGFPVEFAFLVDLDGDGKAAELLPQFGDTAAPLAWYERRQGRFIEHVVSGSSYGHGIGAGDVNGDGRVDIVTPKGWLEAPRDPRQGDWSWHPEFDLGQTGFIHVLDVNRDGRNDLVTTAAHDYGVYWLEQKADRTWTKHIIDDTWSQAHAMTLFDLNGDGQLDLVTGKRYMAHDHDPGAREPLGLYWYEWKNGAGGEPVWFKHVIDYSSRAGAGMQIRIADINSDGAPDIVVGGKTGVYVFQNLSNRRRP